MDNKEYITFGIKFAELEKEGKITFAKEMEFDDIRDLAEDVYNDYLTKHLNSYKNFADFIPFALSVREECHKYRFNKYYVEVWSYLEECDGYLLHSRWYDTIEECYAFVNSFDYIDPNLRFSLMTAPFTLEGDCGDIEILEEDMTKEKRYGHN